ncbi:hypothetical protein N9N28_18040 [Rubripirellula amarantea]|nr:hypothetical protein [Rubripirellula amarantea]
MTADNHRLQRSGGGWLARLPARRLPPPAEPYRYDDNTLVTLEPALSDSHTTNYWRRLLGITLCLLPVWLVVTSFIATDRLYSTLSSLILAPALLIAVTNFHLSFLRPWLHKRRQGTMDNYKFVSGIPMVGTILVVLGLALGFGAVIPTCLAAAATLLDTAGSPWFLAATWRDRTLRDG